MNKRILFLGDFFYDFDFISDDIENIAEWIQENNLVTVLNLESPIGKGNEVKTKKRGPNLASSLLAVDILKKLNVCGVCLANNHMMDYGKQALEDTISILDANGIRHVGAGCNIEASLEPMSISLGDSVVSVLNFGWDVEETIYAGIDTAGCAPRDNDIVLSAIRKAKENSDLVIACMHWGFEYNRLPMPFDIDLAHRAVDAGCDLIIGHHPHVVQPKEIYKGKSIYYSLGNFYFSSSRSGFSKRFNEPIFNQSDYGCMVLYDVASQSFEEHLICYDHINNRSDIVVTDSPVLEDISGINWNTKQYTSLANKRKVNINPILSCDAKKNKKLLARLYSIYKIKAMLKSIIQH